MTSISLTSDTGRLRLLPRARDIADDAAYLTFSLPVGVAAFSIVVTGLALAAGLAITLAGIPILLATLLIARGIAELERRRAGLVLEERIHGREQQLDGGLWQRTKTALVPIAAWGARALSVGTARLAKAMLA